MKPEFEARGKISLHKTGTRGTICHARIRGAVNHLTDLPAIEPRFLRACS